MSGLLNDLKSPSKNWYSLKTTFWFSSTSVLDVLKLSALELKSVIVGCLRDCFEDCWLGLEDCFVGCWLGDCFEGCWFGDCFTDCWLGDCFKGCWLGDDCFIGCWFGESWGTRLTVFDVAGVDVTVIKLEGTREESLFLIESSLVCFSLGFSGDFDNSVFSLWLFGKVAIESLDTFFGLKKRIKII